MTLAFYLKKIVFFWRHAFRNQNSHLWNTPVTLLEHNCHILGTQSSHLWNAMCSLCGEDSDNNTVTVLITTQ